MGLSCLSFSLSRPEEARLALPIVRLRPLAGCARRSRVSLGHVYVAARFGVWRRGCGGDGEAGGGVHPVGRGVGVWVDEWRPREGGRW